MLPCNFPNDGNIAAKIALDEANALLRHRIGTPTVSTISCFADKAVTEKQKQAHKQGYDTLSMSEQGGARLARALDEPFTSTADEQFSLAKGQKGQRADGQKGRKERCLD